MREIKFRAWVESVLPEETGLYYPSALTLYKGEASMVADKVFAERGEDRFKFKDDTCKFTLMQYTGLHDKNGIEIYEGDIVKTFNASYDTPGKEGQTVITYDTTDKVIFEYGQFKCDGAPLAINTTEFPNNQLDLIEVIGNIYENGDLLK